MEREHIWRRERIEGTEKGFGAICISQTVGVILSFCDLEYHSSL